MKVRVKVLFIKSHGIRIFEMEKKRFLLVKIICYPLPKFRFFLSKREVTEGFKDIEKKE